MPEPLDIAALREERDSAQHHLAYHLADFRPGVDMEATGDLAVDMAHYAERMRAEREAERERGRALRAAVEALAEEWEARADAADVGKFAKREKWVPSLRSRVLELRALLATHVPSPLPDGGAARAGEGTS